MTIKLQASPAALIRPMVAVTVAVPLVALLGYPMYYLSLSEPWQMMADLPQDLLLVLIGEAVALPLFLLGWLWRARSHYWLVSDAGVEIIDRGVKRLQISWNEVESLRATGGTVTLLTRGVREIHRIRFVDATHGVAASKAFDARGRG